MCGLGERPTSVAIDPSSSAVSGLVAAAEGLGAAGAEARMRRSSMRRPRAEHDQPRARHDLPSSRNSQILPLLAVALRSSPARWTSRTDVVEKRDGPASAGSPFRYAMGAPPSAARSAERLARADARTCEQEGRLRQVVLAEHVVLVREAPSSEPTTVTVRCARPVLFFRAWSVARYRRRTGEVPVHLACFDSLRMAVPPGGPGQDDAAQRSCSISHSARSRLSAML